MSKKTQRKVSEFASSSIRPVAGTSRPTLSAEFNPDYSEIVRDLKKTSILAGAFIGILVVLSFFLR